jgi:ParB family chromosome partitioning protein
MNPSQLINQSSGEVEYYTDPKIIEAARSMMGEIELDPASSAKANTVVKALTYYTHHDDTLNRPWFGTVWLNHPFGRAEEACTLECRKTEKNPKHIHHSFPYFGNAAWINKLIREWQFDNVTEALCITYACTSEKWFQPLLDFPQCFLCPRTNYYLPDGTIKKGVTKGSVITYLGPNTKRFLYYFKSFGKCHKPL